jgi:hypothetical protein
MSRLIRVGDQFINLDNVTKIKAVRDDLVVYFLGDVGVKPYVGPTNVQTYTGWMAEELLKELDAELERVTDYGEETE